MGLRAFSSAVSGLQGHDAWLDVIGNNIANTDTTAYKASRLLFADQLSQKISYASGGSSLSGGVNASQIGTGSRVQTVQTLFAQGALQNTGNSLDMSIDGDGFLQVRKGDTTYLTRAGNLHLDGEGNLVDGQGGMVQGYNASVQYDNTSINSFSNIPGEPMVCHRAQLELPKSGVGSLSSIRIPPTLTSPPKATSKIEFTGNLDAAQQADKPGGVFNLGTVNRPVLPVALNIYAYGPAMAIDTTRLTAVPLGGGGFAFKQVKNISSTVAYPVMNGGLTTDWIKSQDGNYAWEQEPPLPPAVMTTSTVYDSVGAPRDITVMFYQINDLGEAGVNPPEGPNQAVYAWYAFETTGGQKPSVDNLVGGTGLIEGNETPQTNQWYYDHGISGNLYLGDFLWFNTDGSLASTGGCGGPIAPPGTPNFLAVPRIYIPTTNVNPPISPIPNQGAEITAIDLDFGTPGLITDGKRDGLYSDAAGSYQVINGTNQYIPNSSANASKQDGYQEGQLQSLDWDTQGVLNGHFSNGQDVGLARLGIARVQNPDGLERAGGSDYVQTANSGDLYSGTAGSNGLGLVRGGTLEASNVDLSTELTNMIIAQRGFDANAQVISAANDMEKVRAQLAR